MTVAATWDVGAGCVYDCATLLVIFQLVILLVKLVNTMVHDRSSLLAKALKKAS